jgi:hypothetical protein
LVFFAALMVSCEDVIDVNLNKKDLDLYAVWANITTIDEPVVYLYKALPVTVDEPYSGVSGAVVTLSDNAVPSNSIILVESVSEKGLYLVPENQEYLGVAGREYSLTIQHAGVTLTGKDLLSKVAAIDSIQVHPSARGENRFLGVFTYGIETPGLGNNYKWEVYINNVSISEGDNLSIAEDEMVDGNYIYGLEILTDYYNPDQPEDRKINENDTLFVKQKSISKFAYNYYSQIGSQGNAGFLFSVPPANVKGNITASDGKPVMGLFTANDVSFSDTLIIDSSIESQLVK